LGAGERRGAVHRTEVNAHRGPQRARVEAHQLDDVPDAAGALDGGLVFVPQLSLSLQATRFSSRGILSHCGRKAACDRAAGVRSCQEIGDCERLQ
jgi:hypothetical protein